jgi:ribosome-associated protein
VAFEYPVANMIEINDTLSIPDRELTFVASRASGPGGQHVNKASTRITLLFDLAGSASLSATQKRRAGESLRTRLTRTGVLRLSCGRHRSAVSNRRELIERFVLLLREALRKKPRRIDTRPSAGARERRLREKKHRRGIKQGRGPVSGDE